MRFTIYCHTCVVSGKKYVGQTCTSIMRRWIQHVSDATTKPRGGAFHAAIRKYGADNFTHEVIDIVVTQEGANIAETRWIEHLNTLCPFGYNLDCGGKRHADTRAKISAKATERVMALSKEERVAKATAAIAKQWATMTPEQYATRNAKISAAAKTRLQALSPEERSERARKSNAARTPERRSQISKIASIAAYNQSTPEQRHERAVLASAVAAVVVPREVRSAAGKKGAAAMLANTTPEELSERRRSIALADTRSTEDRSRAARKGNASLTSEQRSEIARKRNANMTPEARSARSRRGQETARKNKDQRSS